MMETEELVFRGAMKAAQGDQAEARRIIQANVKFAMEGEDDARWKAATELRHCPFTSVFMCTACAASGRSPARALSNRYAKLAKDLDLGLFEELCSIEEEWPRAADSQSTEEE